MSFGADFGASEFNAVEFNQAPINGDVWTLYLDLLYVQIPVFIGFSNRIPAGTLYPNSEYRFIRSGLSPMVEVRFTTPPAIAYDGLGG